MHIRSVRRSQVGVTLIELIVTMSIIMILMTVGVSGWTALIKRNARAAEVNALVANLNYARSQAVLRGTTVMVCSIDPDNLPDEPAEPCASIRAADGDREWHQGYAVWVEDSGERLRIQPPSTAVTIETGNAVRFRFWDDGSGTNDAFRVCDASDDADSDAARGSGVAPPRAVIVSPVGRVRVAEKMSGGSDISCSGDAPEGG
jgi:type IV fimbrial biogenesis protein FimT